MDARAAATPRKVMRRANATPRGVGCRIGPRNATSLKEPVIPASSRRTNTPASQTAEKAPVHLRFFPRRTFATRYASTPPRAIRMGVNTAKAARFTTPPPVWQGQGG